MLGERLEEAVVAGDRVVEVARLRRAAEAGQVRGDPADPLEERNPVEGAGRHAVQVEHRSVARAEPVDLESGDLGVLFGDLHGRAVHTITRSMADRRRLRRIRDKLRREYGRPLLRPHRAPVDELILTVLSQNTNDRNRDVAYGRLRERFGSWDEVRDAPVEEIEDAIRPGGLAPTKAVRIKQILEAIGDDDLAWLEEAPLDEARDYLVRRCPGVGRKTAACVLLFSFGRPDVPVDTHVYRVGSRLGLWREKASFDEAHDEMLRLVGDDGQEAYEVHVLLIRHGRRTCSARSPDCAELPAAAHVPGGPAAARARMTDARATRLAPARPARAPVPDRDRGAAGPDRRDRHLPRDRRARLPAAHDPAALGALRLLRLPVRPDAALPRAHGLVGRARRLRALEAAPAERGRSRTRWRWRCFASCAAPRRSSAGRRSR